MEITDKDYMVNEDNSDKRSWFSFISVNYTSCCIYAGCKNQPGEMISDERIVLKCEMTWKAVRKVLLISFRYSALIRLYEPR